MLQRAIAGDPISTICTIEAESTAITYSADTWAQLQKQSPNAQWYWIVGTDTLQTLHHWYRREELVRCCWWLVAPRFPTQTPQQAQQIARETSDRLAAESIPLHWQLLAMTPIQISATQVRQAVYQRQPLQSLVPAAVADYIATHQLYQTFCG
jgi:nicotinate-nucleotide adenylyltransferase